jgi:hypothetical protein
MQNNEQKRLAEKLQRMAEKRGIDSPHAEESARHPVAGVPSGSGKPVTEKKEKAKQENE